MNLIGSRPDGWWRDRPGARRRLVDGPAPLVGPAREGHGGLRRPCAAGEVEAAAARGIEARFAPGGPNAADHAIVALVGSLDDAPTLHRRDVGRCPGGGAAPGGRGHSRG